MLKNDIDNISEKSSEKQIIRYVCDKINDKLNSFDAKSLTSLINIIVKCNNPFINIKILLARAEILTEELNDKNHYQLLLICANQLTEHNVNFSFLGRIVSKVYKN